MYQVDDKDKVMPLKDVPQSSVGAPLPLVVADEDRVVLAYYLQVKQPGWDGASVRIVDPLTSEQPIALVRFNHCCVHMFGPPNDEAFAGHPLASRGLRPYGVFQIENSSWIRRLERMNSVHSQHNPERFWKLRHLIFAFHDSTFECICDGFDIRLTQGPIFSKTTEMVRLLARDAGSDGSSFS
jgi:hypothetical protein